MDANLKTCSPRLGFTAVRRGTGGWRGGVWTLFCCGLGVSLPGCQILIGTLMMLQGKPQAESDFRQGTGKDLVKLNSRVVVLCRSPEKARQNYHALDVDLMGEVARRLKAHDISVVDPSRVASWVDDRGGELAEEDTLELAGQFDVDYLISLQVNRFHCRSDDSPGLLQGQAEGEVTVEEFSKRAGSSRRSKTPKVVYTKAFTSKYPLHQPLSVDQVSEPVFRKQFVDRLANELALLFYDHPLGDEI